MNDWDRMEKFKHAKQMRERFTILDLVLMVGITSEEIEQLVEKWVT